MTVIYKILFAGFEGDNNSAKILLDKLSQKENIEKLYLKNNFEKCASQIITYIQKNKYEVIIAFGQKSLIKSIYLERYGCIDEQKYETTLEYEPFKELLTNQGYKVKVSNDAGSYLCNHVYGIGLRYIEQQKINIRYIFIHIPVIKNLTNINALVNVFDEYGKCP